MEFYIVAVFMLILIVWTKYCLPEIIGDNENSAMDDDFDFEGLPGATYEFKMNVGAGGRECFFQNMKSGAELHVSFEVLRGADRNIDLVVHKPNGEVLASELWKSDGSIEKDIVDTGPYEICIDNSFSRFSSKLVYLYIVSYHMADWEAYSDDINKLELTVGNFSNSISKVAKAISDTLRFQAASRREVIRDWYLIHNNNRYINYWSIFQILIIICTSGTQVYFLRKMFHTKNVTPTSKPRA
ncbi:transmembrane emp24 domain-containing protein 5-like [Tubulanus polymorphus]|uniref:transmembrane emp24 domain-containing protein 5-like n=1 Tax=Tubulanus polymorphus TaxID=672921 RepID=UPI003DA56D71